MEQPRKRRRDKESHRWTEDQTKSLLRHVLEVVTDNPKKYEKPTAQKFYTNFSTDKTLDGIEWTTMKAKMRYLKLTYFKALKWREQVGAQLFQSDKGHIQSRIKSICPHFAELNTIFEPMLPADPIRLTDNDFNKFSPSRIKMTENDLSSDNSDIYESEFDSIPSEPVAFVPKIENEVEERTSEFGGEMCFKPKAKHKNAPPPPSAINIISNADFEEMNEEDDHEENAVFIKNQLELECAKYTLERKKLHSDLQFKKNQITMSRLQFNLDKDKFEFEKRKIMEDQRLRKYDIDKQFEVKKLEIEKDERLRRFELECKYRCHKNDDDDVIHNHEESNFA